MVKKNSPTLWYPPMQSFKSYSDCLRELSAVEVFEGLLGFGLFAESLPPIFTSEHFLDYCVKSNPTFQQKFADYIRYDSMRNTNTVRVFGIPTPFTHYQLCLHLRNHWTDILDHFANHTNGQFHKISRIHVRKLNNTRSIFKMNYNSWRTDETPSTDLSIGARYLVHADISTCFPSMYTHCIPWALMTKPVANANIADDSRWENKLDKFTSNTTKTETHGFLIGPHTSNLLSEIILTCIDQELYQKNFSYVRYIDDYNCYVESYEKGEDFIVFLRKALKEFGLSVNDKKTIIEPLPITEEKNWKNRLSCEQPVPDNGVVNYRQLQRFLDLATSLLTSNNDNLAILKYTMKMVASFPLNDGSRILAQKYFLHMAAMFPYLIPDLDQYVFRGLKIETSIIGDWCNEFFDGFFNRSYFEAAAYLLYFAISYDFQIYSVNEQQIIHAPDCVFKTLGSIYFKKNSKYFFKHIYDEAEINYKDENLFNRNWLYCYTTLRQNDLSGDWAALKKNGIKFIV